MSDEQSGFPRAAADRPEARGEVSAGPLQPEAPQYAPVTPPGPPVPAWAPGQQSPAYAPQTVPYHQQGYAPNASPTSAADGWAIAGFVVALVLGFFGSCLPLIWLLSAPASIVCGILGRSSVRYKWMSTTAIVLGVLQAVAELFFSGFFMLSLLAGM